MSTGLELEPQVTEQRSWGRQLAELLGISCKEWQTGPSPDEQTYRAKLQECAPTLNDAMRQEWIGGFDVEQAMTKVGKLADGGKWAKATVQVVAAHDLALEVLKRKPYVVARKTHEAKI